MMCSTVLTYLPASDPCVRTWIEGAPFFLTNYWQKTSIEWTRSIDVKLLAAACDFHCSILQSYYTWGRRWKDNVKVKTAGCNDGSSTQCNWIQMDGWTMFRHSFCQPFAAQHLCSASPPIDVTLHHRKQWIQLMIIDQQFSTRARTWTTTTAQEILREIQVYITPVWE